MNTPDFKRKLTAVLSADVAGYSRLMGEDEAATVRTLEAYKQIMVSLIKQHRGRVIDSPGDNLLAEFASVVDAVQCGVAVQKELQARNADLLENRRMQFRIGINLGDVIEEGERIYGDGVNIAARLEALAEPGGICVSKTAFDHIEAKLPLGYHFLGEQTVKNIAKPVGAYKVLMEPRVTGAEIKARAQSVPVWRHKPVLAGAIALLVLVIGAVVWNFYWRAQKFEPASKEKMAFPLPDKPSIAVLPFVNMSEDPKQEYFSDGLTEEIITALSKVPKLFVIARNSTFSYKGQSPKVRQVAEELGVRYVLEGSVRKSGEQVRITAQLIDALSGHHLWAERYDRELKDIFALQDTVTMKILTALQVNLTDGEIARASAKGTDNLQAYLKVLQAREPFYTITKQGFAEARRLCEEALALDPKYAAAYVYLGSTHFMDVMIGSSKSSQESIKLAFDSLTKAKALDDSYSVACSILGWIYVLRGEYDKAIAEAERAIALEPNAGTAHIWMSLVLTFIGNHDEALRHAERALRLDPFPPGWWFRALGGAYAWVGRYEEAIAAYKRALQRAPDDVVTRLMLTTAYSWAGRWEEARAQAAEVLRINPKFSLDEQAKRSFYKNQADSDRFLEGLREAGLPDKPPLPLPDKPSIAVLPFVNMSEDKGQEYFSDGLTEEIITALSKTPKLFVIARNSTFVYKGKPVNVQQVSRELGVKYVLEGSVRRSGDQLRITAQLIDGTTGNHLWAEKYDRELRDTFNLQDEITMKIITALQVKLTEGELARVYSKGTKNLDAYLKIVEANWLVLQGTRDGYLKARKLAEEAIALDQNYPFAYRILGGTHAGGIWYGLSKNPTESLSRAVELMRRAVELDDSSAILHASLGFWLTFAGEYDAGIKEGEMALLLEPGSYEILRLHGSILTFAGRPGEGIPLFNEALRLDPKPSNALLRYFAVALRDSGRYEEAITQAKRATEQEPNDLTANVALASSLSLAGREEEARAVAGEVLRVNPKFSISQWEKLSPHKDRIVVKRYCDALRKVGLPD